VLSAVRLSGVMFLMLFDHCRTVACWWHSLLVALSGGICWSWEMDDEVPHISESCLWQESLDVTPKTTEHNFIVRSGKSETEVTNNKRQHTQGIVLLKLTTDRHEACTNTVCYVKDCVLYGVIQGCSVFKIWFPYICQLQTVEKWILIVHRLQWPVW